MIAALKGAPATDFRIPPGMRVYRVSTATGLPTSGDGPAIYEAYKPGTEPGTKRYGETQATADADGVPADGDSAESDGGDAAATTDIGTVATGTDPDRPHQMLTGPALPTESAAPSGGGEAGTGSAMLRPRGAPAGGTGGLY